MSASISDYISKQPAEQQAILRKIRQLIQTLLPEAEERLSYGVPSFRLNGISIVYASFKKHIGLYPEPEVIEFFQKELAEYQTAKGTIQFPLDKPVPYALIERIVQQKYGRNESE